MEFDLPDSRLSPRASQRWERGMEEFLSSLGVGEALPAWLTLASTRRQPGVTRFPRLMLGGPSDFCMEEVSPRLLSFEV